MKTHHCAVAISIFSVCISRGFLSVALISVLSMSFGTSFESLVLTLCLRSCPCSRLWKLSCVPLHSAMSSSSQSTYYNTSCLLYVQCNAWHRTDIILLECLSVCPKYLSSSIATAVFARSSSNLECICRSHIWQWRLSSMDNNTDRKYYTRMRVNLLPI